MDRPAFLDTPPDELRSWRALTTTANFLAWLAWEQDRGKDAVVTSVASGDDISARVGAGVIKALYSIAQATTVPAPLEPMEPDDFVDPAARPATRGKR